MKMAADQPPRSCVPIKLLLRLLHCRNKLIGLCYVAGAAKLVRDRKNKTSKTK